MKKYVDFCSSKPAFSETDFEKNFYKCLPLSFFGKTMENIRNHVNMLFTKNCNTKNLKSVQSKLSFDGIHNVYDNYVSYMFKNTILKTEKPIYFGYCILVVSYPLM